MILLSWNGERKGSIKLIEVADRAFILDSLRYCHSILNHEWRKVEFYLLECGSLKAAVDLELVVHVAVSAVEEAVNEALATVAERLPATVAEQLLATVAEWLLATVSERLLALEEVVEAPELALV